MHCYGIVCNLIIGVNPLCGELDGFPKFPNSTKILVYLYMYTRYLHCHIRMHRNAI